MAPDWHPGPIAGHAPMSGAPAYPLAHAVDRLPRAVVRRQAERAELIRSAEPAIDPGMLPQEIRLTPGAAFADRARNAFRATGALMLFTLVMWWFFGAAAPLDILGPLALPALAAGFGVDAWRKSRRYSEGLVIAISATEVAMTSERGVWTTPVAAFEGVAVRGVSGQKEWSGLRKASRTDLQRRQGVGEASRALYWIELAHADPEKSVPLWTFEAGSDSMRMLVVWPAERFARALGRPLLSTAGIGRDGQLAR